MQYAVPSKANTVFTLLARLTRQAEKARSIIHHHERMIDQDVIRKAMGKLYAAERLGDIGHTAQVFNAVEGPRQWPHGRFDIVQHVETDDRKTHQDQQPERLHRHADCGCSACLQVGRPAGEAGTFERGLVLGYWFFEI